MNWRPIAAYLLIAVASVGASVSTTQHVTQYSDDRNAALQVQLDKARHDALVLVCQQNEADRKVQIKVARTEAKANERIAEDPSSSDSARKIRRDQARVQRGAIKDLETRVNKFRCADVK